MIRLYILPDATAKAKRIPTHVGDDNSELFTDAEIVVDIDDYNGNSRVVKHPLEFKIKTHDDERNEQFDLADRDRMEVKNPEVAQKEAKQDLTRRF